MWPAAESYSDWSWAVHLRLIYVSVPFILNPDSCRPKSSTTPLTQVGPTTSLEEPSFCIVRKFPIFSRTRLLVKCNIFMWHSYRSDTVYGPMVRPFYTWSLRKWLIKIVVGFWILVAVTMTVSSRMWRHEFCYLFNVSEGLGSSFFRMHGDKRFFRNVRI